MRESILRVCVLTQPQSVHDDGKKEEKRGKIEDKVDTHHRL